MAKMHIDSQAVRQGRDIQRTIKNQTKVPPNKPPKVDLRDYYIAAALTGLCANGAFVEEMTRLLPEAVIRGLTPTQMVARAARMIADETLIERTK
jgi:hypothetical protein